MGPRRTPRAPRPPRGPLPAGHVRRAGPAAVPREPDAPPEKNLPRCRPSSAKLPRRETREVPSPKTEMAGGFGIPGQARRQSGARTRWARRANQAPTPARGLGALREKAQASNPPTHSRPEIRGHGRAHRGAGARRRGRHARPRPAPGGPARGGHARYSPVFWRQTRCEKERPAGLRHLYTALPPPSGNRAEPAHDRLSQLTPRHRRPAPARAPSLPPARRPGTVGEVRSPTEEHTSPRACSSRPRGRRARGARGGDAQSLESRLVGLCRRSLALPEAQASPPFV